MAGVKVERASKERLKMLGVDSWGIWEKDASVFDYSYEEPETCFILEGRAVVRMKDGGSVEFKAGDLVTFPSGLDCTWEIREKIRKRYAFGLV